MQQCRRAHRGIIMAAEVNASGRVQIHCSRVAEQLVGYGLDQCRRRGVRAL